MLRIDNNTCSIQSEHCKSVVKDGVLVFGFNKLFQADCRRFKDDAAVVEFIKSCTKQKNLCDGRRIHGDIMECGLLGKNVYVGTALVNMYAKCGCLTEAQEVFDELPFRNTVLWNVLIAGYAQHACGHQAIECFVQMRDEGIPPDAATFPCIFKSYACVGAAEKGRELHAEIVGNGLFEKNITIGNAIVDMYAKFGELAEARKVFDELPVRTVISWNVMIAGYAQQQRDHETLDCVKRMQDEGLSPDSVTFTCLLKACGSLRAAKKGEEVHDEIVRQGLLEKNTILGNALVDMYAKCGALGRAKKVFDNLLMHNIVTWNTLITAYAQHEHGNEALSCLERMKDEGISPNAVTFISALKACGSIRAHTKGAELHAEVVRCGILDNNLLGTALVDMYAKCGALAKAQNVFYELVLQDVVSWSALIDGYAQNGCSNEALACFEEMKGKGLFPNAVTYACIFKACADVGAIQKGKVLHAEAVTQGLVEKNILLGIALIDMYAKCGALTKARGLFDELPVRDVISWSALIAGYAHHGLCDEAQHCMKQMRDEGHLPDAITFNVMLNACNHSGKVSMGEMMFSAMSTLYGVSPNIDHRTCIVDLFARAGHLEKAIAVIEKTPFSVCGLLWLAFLGACRKWENLELGKFAFNNVMKLFAIDVSNVYVCMSNIYAASEEEEEENVNFNNA